jgi:hypothetical protein
MHVQDKPVWEYRVTVKNCPELYTIAWNMWKARRESWARWEEYHADEVARGLRPSHCPHGRNMWLDQYCQECEEGLGTWDYLTQLSDVMSYAKMRYSTWKERQKIYHAMLKLDRHAPVCDVLTWINEPVKGLL